MRIINHPFIASIAVAVASAGLASIGPATAAPRFFDSESTASHSAQGRVDDALSLVQQMKANPGLAATLWRAEGVFIIPHYGKVSFVVGGQRGEGVLLVKRHGAWTSPAFFSLGGGSVARQAGDEGGAVVMMLMTHRAVNRFESSTLWSLNGNAGLTVANWSAKTQGNTAPSDIILWTNAGGLDGGLTVSLIHISPDTKMDRIYYQHPVTSIEILSGNVSNPNADALRNALGSRGGLAIVNCGTTTAGPPHRHLP